MTLIIFKGQGNGSVFFIFDRQPPREWITAETKESPLSFISFRSRYFPVGVLIVNSSSIIPIKNLLRFTATISFSFSFRRQELKSTSFQKQILEYYIILI